MPRRAAARAASIPAWPAPMTAISHFPASYFIMCQNPLVKNGRLSLKLNDDKLVYALYAALGRPDRHLSELLGVHGIVVPAAPDEAAVNAEIVHQIVLAAVLQPAYKKAAALRPQFDAKTRDQLQILARLEEMRSASLDEPADTFAKLLSAAADEISDPVQSRVLHQLLYHLGRWVYLIDAADDLKKDLVSGSYNPIALRYGLKEGRIPPEIRPQFVLTLDHSIHMAATAFELLDFGIWTNLLTCTIYGSLFAVGRAVLDGTFHTLQKEHKKYRLLRKPNERSVSDSGCTGDCNR